jgi:hypothetical protein
MLDELAYKAPYGVKHYRRAQRTVDAVKRR